MSFVNEFFKASSKVGSFAQLLGAGEEEKALTPTPAQASFSRDSDVSAKDVKPVDAKKNIVVEYWDKIPAQMKPFAAIGGGLGALFLVKKYL